MNDKKPLTALRVERHKKGELSDSSPHAGLRLIANLDGTKTWQYRYRMPSPDNRLLRMKLGDFPVMSLSEARVELLKNKALRNKGIDPKAHRDAQIEKERQLKQAQSRAEYSVGDMIKDYLDGHIASRRTEKGQIECKRMLNADVVKVIGDLPASEVKRSDIHALIEKIKARAPRIATMVKVELNGAFEYAISAGKLDQNHTNPTVGVKTPTHKARTRAFRDGELEKFLLWLPKSKLSETMKSVLTIVLLTGCRGGEVVGMRWQDLDFSRAEWFLPKTKNGKPHLVLLSNQCLSEIRKMPQNDSDYVFPSPHIPGKHIRQHAIVWQVSNNWKDSGLEKWTGHDVRRSVGTGLGRLKCPRVIQDRILNHTDNSVSATYDRHTYDEEAKEWWQIWADHLVERSRCAAKFIILSNKR